MLSASVLACDGLQVRSMRIRGAGDAPPDRGRIEARLRGIGTSSLGLPPRVLLFVRCIELRVAGGCLRAHTDDLGSALRLALGHYAVKARRPWCDADAYDADAVLFADEAEMVACLLRDWLRGRLEKRWWWRSVLAGADVTQWLRRHVLSRGEVLAPAVSLLAAGEVVAWAGRLQEADSRTGVEAMARAYALPILWDISDRGAAAFAQRGEHRPDLPAHGVLASKGDARAVARLLAIAPELRTSSPDRLHGRLLLAVVLVVARAPSWARTPQFETAIRALGHVEPEEDAAAATPGATTRARSPRRRKARQPSTVEAGIAPDTVSSPASTAGDVTTAAPPASVARARPRGAAHDSPIARAGRSHAARLPTRATGPRPRARPPDAVPGFGHEALPRPAQASDEASGSPIDRQCLFAQSRARASPPSVTAERTATRYAGIFYLLNAAIALELYSDFTAPRGPNLALSPWDWLALAGRSWFGEPFLVDPVWELLAQLAGRDPEEAPGRDFEPPAGWGGGPEGLDAWTASMLSMLRERLALALGPGPDVDVPAFVCRHSGEIEATAGAVDVHLALHELPLEIRIAGLDRDPGWIPAAGRAVRFHFD
jgi:hypothetical protein